MNQRLARKNLRTALLVGAFCMVCFILTFLAAAVYVA
ncbi:MAG: hypothetical protein QOD61_220 [Solirubrobacteraceae bacterium]|jgi:hypothetical protein|nr:hypothetical protein [Solirubrobacteraceae bacterium]MEA2354091.1 hypothetical protein [Solirubrobacteraceae bacterium]